MRDNYKSSLLNVRARLQSFGLMVLLVLSLLVFQSQTTRQVASQGTIGEVRYSILTVDVFKSLNGDGWELMQGQNVSDINFKKITGLSVIPDARGVFIRGVNSGRDKGGDPAGDKRKVGEPQNDAVGTHSHEISDYTYAESNGGNQGLMGNEGQTDNDNGPISPFKHDTNNTKRESPTSTDVADETRPKNISLFVYIKIRN